MSRLLSVVFLLAPLHVFGQLAQYVNPFVGTGGHGHTFPGATAPFGMVQLSPDTRIDPLDWDGCSGYHYSDSLIYGFSHTHLSGTGVADYGDVLIVPYTHGARLEPAEYAQPFKKNTEKATPGYYSVLLERDRIRCEMTATERVGMHRYSYPLNREKGKILIDLRHRDEVLDAHLEVVGPTEIAGYRISKGWAKEQHLYFVVRFSKRIAGSIVLDMTKNPREAMPSVTSKGIVGLFDFYLNEEPVVVAMGISGVSMEGARRNLDAECKDLDFDKVRSETLAKWEAQLGKIDVQGGSMEQRSTFYSALYHSMLAPNIWNDVDGQYRGRDNTVHRAEGHDVYSVFSLWDTHRAAHPLLAILEPKRTNDFVQTFLRQYEQGGLLPVWELAANETDCMIGYHSVSVIADAYAKGIRGFDLEKAVEAAQKSANQDRLGLASFRKLGYVAADAEPESVSKTLEYAYDDWCVGQLALAAGNKPVFEEFSRRAQYYKNVFDPGTSFFRAKNNAKWHEPFDPFEVNFNYTEANA
jgi:predicted alpha-1,2-mannosidase